MTSGSTNINSKYLFYSYNCSDIIVSEKNVLFFIHVIFFPSKIVILKAYFFKFSGGQGHDHQNLIKYSAF